GPGALGDFAGGRAGPLPDAAGPPPVDDPAVRLDVPDVLRPRQPVLDLRAAVPPAGDAEAPRREDEHGPAATGDVPAPLPPLPGGDPRAPRRRGGAGRPRLGARGPGLPAAVDRGMRRDPAPLLGLAGLAGRAAPGPRAADPGDGHEPVGLIHEPADAPPSS